MRELESLRAGGVVREMSQACEGGGDSTAQ